MTATPRSVVDSPDLAAGLFGPIDVTPLLQDLVPVEIMDAMVRGFGKKFSHVFNGIIQNDGRIFPESTEAKREVFCPYCTAIRDCDAGSKLCRDSDVAGVDLMLHGKAALHMQSAITPQDSLTPAVTSYICHAGNLEILAPILLDLGDGIHPIPIGGFWGGQILTEKPADLGRVLSAVVGDDDAVLHKLSKVYTTGREKLTVAKIRAVEEALGEWASAISKLASNSYRLKQAELAAKTERTFVAKLTETIKLIAAQPGQKPWHELLSRTLRPAFHEMHKLFKLRSTVLYRIEMGDRQYRAVPVVSFPGYPHSSVITASSTSLCPSRLPLHVNPETMQLTTGSALLADQLGLKVLRVFGLAETADSACCVSFCTSRSVDYLLVCAEDTQSPWQVRDGKLQPVFASFLRHICERLGITFDTLDLLLAEHRRTYLLDQSRRELESRQRMTETLVVRMAHLVSRPLLQLDLAMDTFVNSGGQSRTQLSGCLIELRRAVRTFETFESLTQPRRAQPADRPRRFCIAALIEEVIAFMQPLISLKRRPVDVSMATSIRAGDRMLIGRREAVREILENVLHNAIKYSVGGRAVEVNLRDNISTISVEITNYGCGICPEERERVFQLEFRSESAKQVEVEGSGIGLWVARELANREGGTVQLIASDPCDQLDYRGASIQRHKTIFSITLPCT